MNHGDEQSQHRLFAAIVLMGTSLAAGCGGIAEGERQAEVGGHGNFDTGGTAASSRAGNGAGAATSTGGSVNIGDAPRVGFGGTPADPGAVAPGPFDCPPQQWTCTSQECDYFREGWAMPAACDCDPKRPLSASDCELGEVFVCQRATSTDDGRPLTKPVALSCSCVQRTTNFCNSDCAAGFGGRDLICYSSEDKLSAMCGCAVIYLR